MEIPIPKGRFRVRLYPGPSGVTEYADAVVVATTTREAVNEAVFAMGHDARAVRSFDIERIGDAEPTEPDALFTVRVTKRSGEQLDIPIQCRDEESACRIALALASVPHDEDASAMVVSAGFPHSELPDRPEMEPFVPQPEQRQWMIDLDQYDALLKPRPDQQLGSVTDMGVRALIAGVKELDARIAALEGRDV